MLQKILVGNYTGLIFAARSKRRPERERGITVNSSWKVDRMWVWCEQKAIKNFAGKNTDRIFATPHKNGVVLHKTV